MPQMIGAALLLVVLLPFEESLHSLNILIINYLQQLSNTSW